TDSGWIGPYDSGILYTTSHVWNRAGHYEIKAKAKDVHGSESDWSDPLGVSMPKNSITEYKYNIEFLQIFEELFKKIKGKSIIYRVIISYNSEDYIEEIISNIDEELITNYVQTLQDFGPKETGTEACIEAEEYVFNELQNMDLFVQFLPWISEEYDARNIEAVLPGENDECVIISGHLDTVHGSPGADDDCTGIAAVLAAAKTISEYLGDDKLFYTIRFVAFTGKEQGLYGSKDYANNAKESGLEIIAHLGTDMLGHTGNYKDGTEFVNIMRRSTSDWIAEFSKNVAKKYEESIGLTISKKTGGADSDYWAFLLNDYDAVFFHESYFNPYWHTPDDTIDKLDLEYDSRVTRLIVATLLSLADNEFGNQPPSPPSQLSGPSSGKPGVEYNYSCKSFDNEGDQIYFQWDWGDGSFSDWLGPYDHDIRLRTPHTWDNKGDFDVRVKAKDEYGAESDWSDPLSISMPKNRRASFPILNNLLVRYFDNHPFMDGAFVHL
ncbi:MAG: M28 family peptidase, partial [Thermoplasmatales archaeon]